ncbi:MAG: phosphoglucosamine mutase [Tissierellia bacterium]|nr:phosphoglucosamine mutase [Tissierellia bacterium]
MKKLFGTDGIRGVANEELSPELAYKVGRAAAYELKDSKNKIIVIGRDTRISGDLLRSALTAGILSVGVDVIDVGIVPTPAIAYFTREYEAAAGIVISASHNPGEFNGIKFFSSKGFKFPDKVEIEIEELIENIDNIKYHPTGSEVGVIRNDENAADKYADYLKSKVDIDLSGMKIVIDCGHGATLTCADKVFKDLGAEAIILNDDYNGMDINDDCGSTKPELVQEAVIKYKADIGLSFDGDGDRLIAIDEKGKIMDGDHYLAACATHLMHKGKLPDNMIVSTVMCNLGLREYADKNGMKVIMTPVGDRYVLEEMIAKGYSLGGEQSGHFIYLEDSTTGDGILSALKLLETMIDEKKSLSELNELMITYPQVLKNAKVSNESKFKYQDDEVINKAIREFEDKFTEQGRVLIRPSGTEPLVRVMVEGKELEVLERESEKLVKIIEDRLG